MSRRAPGPVAGPGAQSWRQLVVPWAAAAGAPHSSGYEPVLNPADFVHAITNPYFPLPVGRTLIYRGIRDGVTQIDTVHVTSQTRVLEGRGHLSSLEVPPACRAVPQRPLPRCE